MSNSEPDTETDEPTDESTADSRDEQRPTEAERERPADQQRAQAREHGGPDADDLVEIYDLNRHRVNGDETIVLLSAFGRGYQALAIDVDKAGEILATEEIGDADDRQRAESMCRYWVQQHPKGILGGDESEGDGGGLMSKLGIGGGGE